MRRLPIALLAPALAFPAAASDKYIVHDDRPMDDARRPAPGKALIYFVRTQTAGFAIKFKLHADGRFVGLLEFEYLKPADGFAAPPWKK